MTSEGWLRGCLLTSYGSRDILASMRDGASDEEIKNIFKSVMLNRVPYWLPIEKSNKQEKGIKVLK
jgi:molybdenum cofactor biosynthesis enzyme MoaA